MKDSFTAAVTAVLGLLAVGFAAATLTTTNSSGGAGSGPGSGGGAIPFPEREPASPAPTDIPFAEFMLLALVLALVALLVYAAVFRRALFRRLVAVAVPFVLAGVVAYLLLVVLGDLSGSAPAQPALLGNGSTPGGPPGDGGSSDPSSPLPLGPLAVLGVALVGVALVVVRARGGSGGASDDTPDPDSDRRAAVGRAAGRAADRLEEGGDNEVYRAWREMTDLLDVEDPETSTPGEFADAAVDAGLGGEAVHELTRLFEDVRYGDAPPTDSEDRAVAVFRQIEQRYAETAEGGTTEGEA